MGKLRAVDYSLINLVCKQDCFQSVYNKSLSEFPCDKKIAIIFFRVLFAAPIITLALLDIPICLGRTIFRLFAGSFTCENLQEFPRHMIIFLIALPLLLSIVLKPLLPFKKESVSNESRPVEERTKTAQPEVKKSIIDPLPPEQPPLDQPAPDLSQQEKEVMMGWHPLRRAQAGFYGSEIRRFFQEGRGNTPPSTYIKGFIKWTVVPHEPKNEIGSLFRVEKTADFVKDLIQFVEDPLVIARIALETIIDNLVEPLQVSLEPMLEQQLTLLAVVTERLGPQTVMWQTPPYCHLYYWIMGLNVDGPMFSLGTEKLANGKELFEDPVDVAARIFFHLLEQSSRIRLEFNTPLDRSSFRTYIWIMENNFDKAVKEALEQGKDPLDSLKKQMNYLLDQIPVSHSPIIECFRKAVNEIPKNVDEFTHLIEHLRKRAMRVISCMRFKLNQEIAAVDTGLQNVGQGDGRGRPMIEIISGYVF